MKEKVRVDGYTEKGDLVATRKFEDGTEQKCMITPAEDGKAVPLGADLICYGEQRENGWRDITTIVSNRKGPAQVATRSYCEGYDRVFGKKKPGLA